MISRLTTLAAIFSVLATASIAYAATSHQEALTAAATAKTVRVIQLQPVVVVGKRLAPNPR